MNTGHAKSDEVRPGSAGGGGKKEQESPALPRGKKRRHSSSSWIEKELHSLECFEIPIDPRSYLEVIDSKKRYGKNLRLYYKAYQEQTPPLMKKGSSGGSTGDSKFRDFFEWLDSDGNKPEVEGCSRQLLESESVFYCDTYEQAERYKVIIDPETFLLVQCSNKKLLTTISTPDNTLISHPISPERQNISKIPEQTHDISSITQIENSNEITLNQESLLAHTQSKLLPSSSFEHKVRKSKRNTSFSTLNDDSVVCGVVTTPDPVHISSSGPPTNSTTPFLTSKSKSIDDSKVSGANEGLEVSRTSTDNENDEEEEEDEGLDEESESESESESEEGDCSRSVVDEKEEIQVGEEFDSNNSTPSSTHNMNDNNDTDVDTLSSSLHTSQISKDEDVPAAFGTVVPRPNDAFVLSSEKNEASRAGAAVAGKSTAVNMTSAAPPPTPISLRGEGQQVKVGTTSLERWIFVLRKESFFVHPKITKTFPRFHHSSFFGGAPVDAAGIFSVREGRIEELHLHSGHYRPTEIHLYRLLLVLLRHMSLQVLADVQVDAQRIMHIARMVNADGSKMKKLLTISLWPASKMLDFLTCKKHMWGNGVFRGIHERGGMTKKTVPSPDRETGTKSPFKISEPLLYRTASGPLSPLTFGAYFSDDNQATVWDEL